MAAETAESNAPVAFANAFENLVQGSSCLLGPSSAIDSADEDPQEIISMMEAYISKQAEWERYALADFSWNYARNLVDKENGKCNLVGLVR